MITCLTQVKGSSKSVLTTPSSNDYNTDRLGFNLRFDYKPVAIFHPSSEDQAAGAIQCAAIHNVSVAPRSGGHSYEGYSMGGKDGALIIDLNLFQNISVDTITGIATIAAGVRLGDLYARIWEAGQYLISAGTCLSVGIGGIALGGGLGMVSRKYGVFSDSIVSMTMIDACGNVQEINATSNTDLFWAMRGAGAGSFGLVTEFKIQAYKPPNKVTTISVKYPLETYQSVIEAYGAWGSSATHDVMASMILNQNSIHINVNYLGLKEQAQATIDELLKNIKGEPTHINMVEGTWPQAATKWGGSKLNSTFWEGNRYARSSSLLYETSLSINEMDIIYKYLNNSPNNGTVARILIDIWGGMIDLPSSPSVFDSHRGTLYSIQFFISWSEPSDTPGLVCPECLKWSKNFDKEMQAAYGSGRRLQAYQNYIERDLPNWLQAYYGDNTHQLQQIKKRVDPHNVFTFPQAIPLP